MAWREDTGRKSDRNKRTGLWKIAGGEVGDRTLIGQCAGVGLVDLC